MKPDISFVLKSGHFYLLTTVPDYRNWIGALLRVASACVGTRQNRPPRAIAAEGIGPLCDPRRVVGVREAVIFVSLAILGLIDFVTSNRPGVPDGIRIAIVKERKRLWISRKLIRLVGRVLFCESNLGPQLLRCRDVVVHASHIVVFSQGKWRI